MIGKFNVENWTPAAKEALLKIKNIEDELWDLMHEFGGMKTTNPEYNRLNKRIDQLRQTYSIIKL